MHSSVPSTPVSVLHCSHFLLRCEESKSFLPRMSRMAADPIQFTTDHTDATDTDPRIMVLSGFISVIRGQIFPESALAFISG